MCTVQVYFDPPDEDAGPDNDTDNHARPVNQGQLSLKLRRVITVVACCLEVILAVYFA